ncbi:ABC transporter permease [Rhodobacter sp. Har01]|uniref:ABC transporter permease n=1 Tax=Rhodobacter sp. Har01 TaxID=2883999 RepID=UPI001D089473|nr:ABC transporter permease [Rhodobacter sp. Har01]MCB6180060.1 ABC transporter permease [Rhodobacter sp. Har01]
MSGLLTRISPQTLRLVALALALLATILFFSTQIDGYLSARMFNRISTSAAVVLPVAVGQAIVIMTRNIDLSIGSTVGVVAYLTGGFLGSHPELHPALALAFAMGVGGLAGAINGVLVAWGRVPSIIVTLGTLALFRTFLVEVSDARTITTASLPQWLVDLPQATVLSVGGLDVRVTVVMAVVACAVMGLALGRLRAARKFYAVGSNPDAAVMAGINAKRVVFVAFMLSGALAGLSGFIFLAKFGNITVVAGMGMELKSVAAVVVGGVSILGGSGTMLGVLIGTVLVDTIDNSLTRWALVSEFWRDALLGMLIMAAVTVDTFASRSLGRLKAGSGGAG